MKNQSTITSRFARSFGFCREEKGAVLVEFALVMPLMLLFFAVTIESARIFWTYQQAVSGVRDAGRYLGRAAPYETCPGWTGMSSALRTKMQDIIEEDIEGASIFNSGVQVGTVVYQVDCRSDSANYADKNVMVATVTAPITVTLPMGAVFGLFGNGLNVLETSVTDQIRVYGQ